MSNCWGVCPQTEQWTDIYLINLVCLGETHSSGECVSLRFCNTETFLGAAGCETSQCVLHATSHKNTHTQPCTFIFTQVLRASQLNFDSPHSEDMSKTMIKLQSPSWRHTDFGHEVMSTPHPGSMISHSLCLLFLVTVTWHTFFADFFPKLFPYF